MAAKTSAIRSQQRGRGKNRLDLDYPALVEPISSTMLNPKKYSLLWAKRWRVALSSLKRTGRVASLTHSVKLTLCDNLAVALAFEKGRSSSPGLNRLGLDIQWRLRHVESPIGTLQMNPPDGLRPLAVLQLDGSNVLHCMAKPA